MQTDAGNDADDELLMFIERRKAHGRGCGFVDLGLMASAMLGDAVLLWTLGKRLATIAAELGRAYRPVVRSPSGEHPSTTS